MISQNILEWNHTEPSQDLVRGYDGTYSDRSWRCEPYPQAERESLRRGGPFQLKCTLRGAFGCQSPRQTANACFLIGGGSGQAHSKSKDIPTDNGRKIGPAPLAFRVFVLQIPRVPRNAVTRVKRLIFDGDIHLYVPKEPRLRAGQTSMEDRKKDDPKTEACMQS